jgi:tRNA threonylcarbamoyladenosine biosynthesis protein TsaB
VNVLAIETSTEWLSLALSRDERRFARDVHVGQRHAEQVFAAIAAILAEAGLAIADLHAVAFGAGPGAFTGLRIACGVAQGLAEARGLPVIGIGSLETVAQESGAPQALAAIDARMGEVYHAAYRRRGPDRLDVVIAPALARPEDARVPEGSGWTGCGSGFAAHRAALAARYAGTIADVKPDILPRARAMLALALPRLAAGEGNDPSRAVPTYLRDHVAMTVAERAARA